MHKVNSILKGFLTALTPLVGNGVSEVIQNRQNGSSKLPSIDIKMGDDTSLNTLSGGVIESEVFVYTDIYIASSYSIDEKALQIRADIHKLLIGSDRLGLPYVVDIDFVRQERPDIQDDTTVQTAIYPLLWRIQYRYLNSDPGA